MLLCGCVAETAAVTPTTDTRPPNVLTLATAYRFRVDNVNRAPPALGSFGRRVWNEEFDRLMRPLRSSPLKVPRELSGETYAGWQRLLDEAWNSTDAESAQATAKAVVRQAVPLRDDLAALVKDNVEPPEAIAAAITAVQIIKEIILDADLLGLRDSGSVPEFEEFIARYPDGPYTGTVLFGLGVMHEDRRELPEAKDAFTRLLRGFPDHPLAAEAQQKLRGL